MRHGKVVTFGEVMMRLSTPGFARLTQAGSFDVVYAGAEANVAVSLAHLGVPAEHVTRFPENDLGAAAVRALRGHGVATERIVFGGERMGLYFLENGAAHRAARIVYDRAGSAFAHIAPGMVDWDGALAGAAWLHWTGITPAISQGAADVCLEALQAARRRGVTVSGDINYRRNLWQYGKTAREVMPALIQLTDAIVAGTGDLENCVGITGATYEEACQRAMEAYPNVRKVASTEREVISSSHNAISGVMWNGERLLRSKEYDLIPIVDRIGAGDAFMAGLIYGWMAGKDDQGALDFATAACAFKHAVEGDANLAAPAEIEALVRGENVGRLLR
ncbi:sugar kinase [Sorangium sp. So ce1036]|uniref:PfkB family carbohydrate kinase n=1 Tax=Sorangium sp. So ce1036 TaxID=3133328 RepID=UPI003F00BD4B